MSRRWINGLVGLFGVLICVLAGDRLLRTMVWNSTAPFPMHPAIPAASLSLSASSCAPCHGAIHREWRASRMGQAMQSPGFLADWNDNQDGLQTCLNCHAPLQAQQPLVLTDVDTVLPALRFESRLNPSFDASLQAEGVTCLACHGAEQGLGSLEDARKACVRCHSMPTSWLHRLDRPLIDTAGEHQRWQAQTGRTEHCVDCHMTPSRDRRKHDFHGAWDEDMAKGGVALAGMMHVGSQVRVHLQNLAGHRTPTGETSPALVVHLEIRDVAGAVLHTDTTSLSRVVRGPPFVEVSDTTLGPAEERTLFFSIPEEAADRAARAAVTVTYERYTNLPGVRTKMTEQGVPITLELDHQEADW